MIKPTILHEDPQQRGLFLGIISDKIKTNLSDFIVQHPALTTPTPGFNIRQESRGWFAVRDANQWTIEDGQFEHSGNILYITIASDKPYSSCAYPIDPRMTRADIEGATRIFANADNTGWLFGHSHEEHHKDHELQLMAGIDAIMQPLFRQYHVDVINGASLNIKQRATALYALLSQFYGEVIGEGRKIARAKHLGERHKGVGAGHIHAEALAAFQAIEAKWKTDRASDATKLATAFTYIKTSLTIPTPETRWDRAARLEAEAKAKAAKEAAEAETATPSESSGS